jgi:predicted ribosomally synthesized peptide with nif11-like leader
MSEITRFNTAIRENAAIQSEVKKIGNNLEKIVAYANSKGYKFTLADLRAAGAKQGELSDQQLDKVAGGVIVAAALLVG